MAMAARDSLSGVQLGCPLHVRQRPQARRPLTCGDQLRPRLQRCIVAAVPCSGRNRFSAASQAAFKDQAPLPHKASDLRSRSKDELAAMLRDMQLSDAGLKPELLQRLREAMAQRHQSGPQEAAPLALSAQTSRAELRALKKEQLATALQTRQLSDKGLKAELVDRLHAALQRGSVDSAASGGRPEAQQAPAAADDAELTQSTATSICMTEADGRSQPSVASAAGSAAGDASPAAPAMPALQAAAAQQQAPVPSAVPASLPSSLPARAAADTAVHPAATRSPAVPAASSAAEAAPPQPQRMQSRAPECDVPTGLAVQWLGTSSGAPTAQRNVSSILLLQRRRVLMVDCGEGTVNQLATARIDPVLVQGVFVTHMHGDHVFGLPGLLRAVSRRVQQLGIPTPETFQIYGPPGVQELLRASLKATMSRLAMPICITAYTTDPAAAVPPTEVAPGIFCATQAPDVAPPPQLTGIMRNWMAADLATVKRIAASGPAHNPLAPLTWQLAAVPGMSITAAPLAHRLPCWGYVFQEHAAFDAAPGSSPANRRTDGTQVGQQGRKVVLLGDTCNSCAMRGPGVGADVLSHECTFSNEDADKAHVAMHSTAAMAGRFAAQLHARHLVLTHFSGRYKTTGDARNSAAVADNSSNTQAYLAQQARAAMGLPPGSRQVGIAQDFLRVDVPPRLPDDMSNQQKHSSEQPQQRADHQRRSAQQQGRHQLQAASTGRPHHNGVSSSAKIPSSTQQRPASHAQPSATPQRRQAAATH